MTGSPHLRATRTFYDTIADDYARRFEAGLTAKPLERSLLAAFAELVRADGAGPVADLGCGTGHVTARLHALGLDAYGVDLSPAMLALARRAHPGLRFEQGSMAELDLPDGALGGVVAWYSVIHTPPPRLPELFSEFHRLLAPGGHLLLAFQAGDEPLHLTRPFGHPVTLDFHRLQPARIAEALGRSGFTVQARLLRQPERDESVPQAFVLARRSARP